MVDMSLLYVLLVDVLLFFQYVPNSVWPDSAIFLNFFATDFITKAAQMFGGFRAVVEKHCFSSQTG